MNIAFDIETIPNSSLMNHLPEAEVKLGNLKDPEKIKEKQEEARKAQIEKMALSPLYGRICCFAVSTDESFSTNSIIAEESDIAETGLIERAFEVLSGNTIITYNGNNFDLPFLYRRAVILGVDPREFNMPPLAELTKKYSNTTHIDLMQAWCSWGNNFEKLDTLGKFICNDHKIDIDFREFPELLKTGEGQKKIADYCQQDTDLTIQIFRRFQGILF